MGGLTSQPAPAGGVPATPDLRVRDLSKSFGGNPVLDGIDLHIEPGSFVGLMGPNGAGKSTLIKILAGVYSATSGVIEVNGQRAQSLADRPDVGFIHQDLGLVRSLSVSDNLRLGMAPVRRLGLLDRHRERTLAEAALARVGLDIDVRTPVGELTPGQQALVAVARTLQSGARLLVVDEATSTLVPRDSKLLIDALRRLCDEGATVIIVSHKLQEVMAATRRIVILIDGRIASDHSTADLDVSQLIELLSGSAGLATANGPAARSWGEVLLRLDQVRAGHAGPVDLELRAGQITGITGQPGSGLYDVAFVSNGTLRPAAGAITASRPLRRALIPPHRETQGGMPTMSVQANFTISSLQAWRSKVGLLRRATEHAEAQSIARRLAVVPTDVSAEFGTLSGGNKQKVIFGRALFAKPDLYVLCEPTRGVDVRTRHEIYALIREIAAGGAAVLIVSSDAEDLFAVCDMVGVIADGRIGELRPRADLTSEDLKAVL